MSKKKIETVEEAPRKSVVEIAADEVARKASAKAEKEKSQRLRYRELLEQENLDDTEAVEFIKLVDALGKTTERIAFEKNKLVQIANQQRYVNRVTKEELKKAYLDAREATEKADADFKAAEKAKGIAKAAFGMATRRIETFDNETVALNRLISEVGDLFPN